MDSKKLHILFLCSWYPSKASPTNGDFIQRHAEAVAMLHKVSVLFITTLPGIKNVQYESTEKDNLTTHIVYIPHQKFGIMKWVFYFKYFFNLLKKIGQFDIVHLNRLYPFGVFALYLKFIRRKKYIISEHWSGYQYPNNLHIHFFEKIISKFITENAAYVCPVTNHLAKEMQKFGLKGNYSPVPNVVDTDLFLPVTHHNTHPVFIHISSLSDEIKNISGILNTFGQLKKILPQFTLYLIGGNKDNYQTLLNSLNFEPHQVIFLEHLPHQEMVKYLQHSDLFVLFSRYENLPCVILESFSCGVPVISTDVGGIKEYFPDGFGKLIPVNDQDALVEELLHFQKKKWADKNEMHSFAEKHFSKNAIANSFHALYLKTI